MYSSLSLVTQTASKLIKYGYRLGEAGTDYPLAKGYVEFAPIKMGPNPALNLVYVVRFSPSSTSAEVEARSWSSRGITSTHGSLQEALQFVLDSIEKAHTAQDRSVRFVSMHSETHHYIQVETSGERRWYRKLGTAPNQTCFWKYQHNGEDWEDAVQSMDDINLLVEVCKLYGEFSGERKEVSYG